MKNRVLSLFVILALFLLGSSVAPAADPLRIMPLGDSVTAGYTDVGTWNHPFNFGYRSGLYELLTDAGYNFQFVGQSTEPWTHASAPPESAVGPDDLRPLGQDNHRGYGGAGISTISSGITSWLAADTPDVILLMIGINNITQGGSGSPTSVQNGLYSLVDTITTTAPNAHLIVAQITPYASYTDSIVQYNNYIANTLVPTYAALGKNVTTVDQYSNMLTTGGAIDTSLFSNGINHPDAVGYDRMAQTWFDGIVALGDLNGNPSSSQAVPVLINGGFESPAFEANSHNLMPEGAWTCNQDDIGYHCSGIDNRNPYGSNVLNGTAYQGVQMGFLQGAVPDVGTKLSQQMTGLLPGKTYDIAFQAKGMYGFQGVNPFKVSLDGTDLEFDGTTVVSPDTVYERKATTFTATSDTAVLEFYTTHPVTYEKVSWIDNVEIGIKTPSRENLIQNPGFETPAYGVKIHAYSPAESGWTYSGGSTRVGIDCLNPYGATNFAPFEGDQMAFLQGSETVVGSIGQTISGLEPGKSYLLSFQSKAIDPYEGATPFKVSFGGTDLEFDGQTWIEPVIEGYTRFTAVVTATSDTATLTFADAGDVIPQKVSWIDNVMLTPVVPEAGTNLVIDGGFETESLPDVAHQAGILGSVWNFMHGDSTSGSGIDKGKPYGQNYNCTPYEGDAMGFMQGANPGFGVVTLSQDVYGFEIGEEYVVAFQAKGIDGFEGVNPFEVSLGGIDVTFDGETVLSPGESWELYISDPITATDEIMELLFCDAGDVSYRKVSFLDDVQIFRFDSEAPAIPGDLNGDGFVGSGDLDIVRANWGQSVTAGDLGQGDPSGDGNVGSADLDIVRANWGQSAPSAVPEPGTCLLLLSVVGVLAIRRR